MKYYPKFFLAFLLSFGVVTLAHAQGSDEARVEFAAISPDGEIVVQVSLPPGIQLDSAILEDNSQTISLQADPAELPTTYWFLLDAGDRMLNVDTRVRTLIQQYLDSFTEGQKVGLVIYNSEADLSFPTANKDEFIADLATYGAISSEPACLGDAINALNDVPHNTSEVRQILVFGGPATRQGGCLFPDPSEIAIDAIDMIIIANETDDIYLDLDDQSSGQLRTANVTTLGARLNELDAIWQWPSFALRGITSQTLSERVRLTLTFTNGNQIEQVIRPAVLDDMTDLGTATDSSSSIVFPDTPVPANPSGEVAQETGTVPTENPTRPPTEQAVADEQLATNVPQVAAIEETVQVSTQPTDIPQDIVEESFPIEAEVLPDEARFVEQQELSERDTPTLNPFILIGGGLVILSLAVLLIYFLLSRRNQSPDLESSQFDRTPIYSDSAGTGQVLPQGASSTALDLYSSGGTGGVSPTMISPIMPQLSYNPYDLSIDPPPQVDPAKIDVHEAKLTDNDELLITQMASEEDFLNQVAASQNEVIGWLRQVGNTSKSFEVTKTGGVIGRMTPADFIVEDDENISTNHARFDVQNDAVWITVSSQTTPIMVSGIVMHEGQSRKLRPQDIIQLSPNTKFVFVMRNALDDEDDDDLTVI